MNVSARNKFSGKITSVVNGAVNVEVELTTAGGDNLVAIVTEASVKSLGLAIGINVIAFVKAPWIMLLTGVADVRFSARNQFTGKVASLKEGAVNSEVGLQLHGGTVVYAVVTNEAAAELCLKQGIEATALIKASHIILGVPVN